MPARHRVSKLLLRQGIVYSGGSAWTGVHLVWLRGMSTLTAFGLAVEVGDWERLTGASIGAYLGLVPTESSSGQSRSPGSITKTGNTHARRLPAAAPAVVALHRPQEETGGRDAQGIRPPKSSTTDEPGFSETANMSWSMYWNVQGELDRRLCRIVVEKRFSATRMAADHVTLYSDVLHGVAGT